MQFTFDTKDLEDSRHYRILEKILQEYSVIPVRETHATNILQANPISGAEAENLLNKWHKSSPEVVGAWNKVQVETALTKVPEPEEKKVEPIEAPQEVVVKIEEVSAPTPVEAPTPAPTSVAAPTSVTAPVRPVRRIPGRASPIKAQAAELAAAIASLDTAPKKSESPFTAEPAPTSSKEEPFPAPEATPVPGASVPVKNAPATTVSTDSIMDMLIEDETPSASKSTSSGFDLMDLAVTPTPTSPAASAKKVEVAEDGDHSALVNQVRELMFDRGHVWMRNVLEANKKHGKTLIEMPAATLQAILSNPDSYNNLV